MASGRVSNLRSSREWKEQKRKAGYERLQLWIPPELVGPLKEYATEEMVPLMVAVEMILKRYLKIE